MEVVESTKTNLLEEIRKARVASDQLFKVLKPEAIYDRPIAERHRVIFYVGHLDGFDSIQICREGLGLKSKDEGVGFVISSGYRSRLGAFAERYAGGLANLIASSRICTALSRTCGRSSGAGSRGRGEHGAGASRDASWKLSPICFTTSVTTERFSRCRRIFRP